MEHQQLTKEKEYAIEWVLENASNHAFVPDMLLAFAEDFINYKETIDAEKGN